MFTLDLLTTGEVRDRPGDLKYPNKDLLYTTHEYLTFVPTVMIRWRELAAL